MRLPEADRPGDHNAEPARYDEVAPYYDANHADAISVRRFARIEADMLCVANGARVVLEIGVGTGRFLSQVTAPHRIGVDLSQPMLAIAAASHRLDLRLGDARALPVADASVDVVVAPKGVLRYVAWEQAFAEIWRVLVPGGQAFVHNYRAATPPLRQRWSLNQIILRRLAAIYEASDLQGVREVDRLASWEDAARNAGFTNVTSRCWRPLRVPPYALEVPRVLPVWSHVVTRVTKRP